MIAGIPFLLDAGKHDCMVNFIRVVTRHREGRKKADFVVVGKTCQSRRIGTESVTRPRETTSLHLFGSSRSINRTPFCSHTFHPGQLPLDLILGLHISDRRYFGIGPLKMPECLLSFLQVC